MPKQKIAHKVRRTILHDGEFIKPGESIDLTPEAAAPLIEIGHLEAPTGTTTEADASATGSKLKALKVDELKEKAVAANVQIPDGAKKDDIIAALTAAGITE